MSDDREWQAPGGAEPDRGGGAHDGRPSPGDEGPAQDGQDPSQYQYPNRYQYPDQYQYSDQYQYPYQYQYQYSAGGSASTAWAPPPKPGLLPLRPLGFGTLLGAPFQVLRRNPKPTFGSALLIQGMAMLASALLMGAVTMYAASRIARAAPEDLATIRAGAAAGMILAVVVAALFTLIGSALLQGVIVSEVARGTLGEKLRMRTLWRRAWGRFGALIGWTLVLAAAAAAGVAALIGLIVLLAVTGTVAGAVGAVLLGVFGGLGLAVLAVWLGVKTCLVPSALVIERAGFGAAIARSWTLTRRNFWRTFGVLALILIILNAVSTIATVPFSFVFSIAMGLAAPTGVSTAMIVGVVSYVLMILVGLVIGAITAVVQSAAAAVIYVDARMRREGLDLELQRSVEARGSGLETPDPFLRSA